MKTTFREKVFFGLVAAGGFFLLVAQLIGCKLGRHSSVDPSGYCTACCKKICRGRTDTNPEGTMSVTQGDRL